jgi:hypothetical protein
VGRGLPAGCDNLDMCGRMFLLIPCDQAGTKPCGGNPSSVYQPTLTSGVMTVALAPDPQRTEQFIKRQRVRLMPRYHLPARY